MNHRDIVKAVDDSIKEIGDKFHSNPTLFFTENDIVCYFYSILQNKLSFAMYPDENGFTHFLVHREYPTPSRYDMKGNRFEVKGDDEVTARGGKYQRGHYDLVVLNPHFINKNPYDVVKAQSFESI